MVISCSTPVGEIRRMFGKPSKPTQRLPSGPAVMARANGSTEVSETCPLVVTAPMSRPSATQIRPSAPVAMPSGEPDSAVVTIVAVPPVVIRPTACAAPALNHIAPSGPWAIALGSTGTG